MSSETVETPNVGVLTRTPRHFVGAVATVFGGPWFGYLARTALTFTFWSCGLARLFDFDGGLAEMHHFGLVSEILFHFATVVTLLVGSALVILDRWSWVGAGALAAFTIPIVPITHGFWVMQEPLKTIEFHVVLEHITVVGGLVVAIYASELGASRKRQIA
ncbi:DoxX family protein [Microvirga sp. TS319]|uniref:DoxX family protein n=1 Tax=Microvirga sp. TS319 TaxID=3241165 RepID=UPI00351A134D